MRHVLRTSIVLLSLGLLGGCSTLTNLWDRITGSPTDVAAQPDARVIPPVVVPRNPVAIQPATARADFAMTAPVRVAEPSVSGADRSQPGADVSASNTPAAAATTADSARAGQTPGHIAYFDFDSSVLRDDARPVIEAHARMLAANPALRITVEGHADERGGPEYNLSLGQKRAEAVLQALVMLGANEAQLEAVSFGEERPVERGSDETSWAKNRRVELKQRR
ncbi:MAG: peptidoglycan-associated lipoprotein Pal [Rubrivivax sp.]